MASISRSCRLCRMTAMVVILLLATWCSSNARACDVAAAAAEGDMLLQQHCSTSPATATTAKTATRLRVRSPQATTDLTVAGAVLPPPPPPSPEDPAAATGQGTSSGLPVGNPTPLPEGYTMPEPFDAILGVNFISNSCPQFFNTFLEDPDYKACHPLSSLLETSSSFFKAMQDFAILPAVMEQICSTDQTTCSGVMDSYATQIQQKSNCGADLALGNALAVAALNSFQNFRLYRDVGCLKNADTQAFCFAEAANATTASDLYLYYLPGGTSLPSGTQPTCDGCSQQVVSAFSTYATNATLRLSETYTNARNVISMQCGPSFAPMVAATSSKSSAATRGHLLSLVMLSLLPASLLLLTQA